MARKPELPQVLIYTDGSCHPNPGGPGGWGAVILDPVDGSEKALYGHLESTTSNLAELEAVRQALLGLEGGPYRIVVRTDSRLVVGWLSWWHSETPHCDQVIQDIREAVRARGHRLTPEWIRGHGTDRYNLRCDGLALLGRVALGKVASGVG